MLILYAEDDVDDYGILEDTLSKISPAIRCVNAPNGREVLDFLEDASPLPDLIFLDINMPTMDGKYCLKAIKNDPRFKAIPVVIYTTSSNEKDKEQCLQLGAENYLIKPYGFSAVEPLIRDVLKPFINKIDVNIS
jgi:CheY-like chemotaxis protein